MSLISTKNLVAPLTNMVHLITILLIAVAFAVLRLSGASISMASSNAPVQRMPQQQAAPAANLGTQLQENKRAPAPWSGNNNSRSQQQAPSQGGGLDDIEKQLGL